MKRFLTLLSSIFLAHAQTPPPRAHDPRPNILFIMTDDHARAAISAYGSKVNHTPNMDTLASQGMLFQESCVTNSICTPNRACVITSKYSHKNGVPTFNAIDGRQQTIPKLMQQAGYYTALIGKWHLGSNPTGFNHWEIFPGQGQYNNPITYDNTLTIHQHPHTYATDLVTNLTIRCLRNRPKNQPFLIYCHHKAPHRNFVPSPKYATKFTNKTFPEPKTLFDNYQNRTDALHENHQTIQNDLWPSDLKLTPPPNLTTKNLIRWKYNRYMQDYLACVQSVDDSIGQLMQELQQQGIADNTLIIYTSDNGWYLGEHGLFDKRFMYEPGLHTPLIARWPNHIKPGSTNHNFVISQDFGPTFLELAHAKNPGNLDGLSILPLLTGHTPNNWRNSVYYRYYHDPGDHNTRMHLGVRTKTHKLIYFNTKNQWEFYDLTQDPDEMHNRYNDPSQQTTINKLKTEITRLQQQFQDTKNTYQNPKNWPKTTPDGSAQSLIKQSQHINQGPSLLPN